MAYLYSDPEMQEIFEGFLIETYELLEGLSHDLIELETKADDLDLINRIFRSFHTIKGTSAFMGFNIIADITHHAEDILNKLRRSELVLTQAILDVLFEVQDWITVLIGKIKDGEDTTNIDYSKTIEQIALMNSSESAVITTNPSINETDDSAANVNNGISYVEAVLANSDFIKKPGDFTDGELKLIEAAFKEVNNQFWDDIKNDNSSKDDNSFNSVPQVTTTDEIDDAEENESTIDEPIEKEIIETPTPKPITIKSEVRASKSEASTPDAQAALNKTKSVSDTIRIDVNRVEALMDLSGELVLGRNRLAQITELLEQEIDNKDRIRDLIETTAQVDFVTSEIQAAVMRMRMVPIGKLYQKAPRIVRDLSKEFGKKINLIVKGEDTEIDRGIIEELNDPLVHMIRNSCDHGIEPTDVRREKGKPEVGTITLDADQEGNNIVLRISDDGAGIDPDKLKAKAIEKGVLTPYQADQMTAREAYYLIFAPGFSTAAVVTAVSGRGVGMDVVRTNIQNLKGMIDIESELGNGSTFIIKLPLTLAIIQGLLVKVHNETYALPLSSVVEVVAINLDSIYSINKQEVIRIRTEVIPIIRLDKALSVGNPDDNLEGKYVVNVGLGMQRVGIVVDELLGQQEIVIKSLGEYLGTVTGIAGSTILGDGRVIMIIDVADLIQSIYQNDFLQFGK